MKSLNIPLNTDHAALHIDRRVDDFKAQLTIAMPCVDRAIIMYWIKNGQLRTMITADIDYVFYGPVIELGTCT